MATATAERPVRSISVTADGNAGALLLNDCIVVVMLPSLEPVCCIPIGNAIQHDIQWLDDPTAQRSTVQSLVGHLLVSEVAANTTRIVLWAISTVPMLVAEKVVDAPLRLITSLGNLVLALGNSIASASVLRKTTDSFSLTMFPTRRLPSAIGQCNGKVLAGHVGVMEEWDLAERCTARTWKLQPAIVPAFVGGTERVLWLVPKQNVRQIDVIPLLNRGQIRQHLLPEPIVGITHHRRADWLIVQGANSSHLYVIDLEGKTGVTALASGDVSTLALYTGRGVSFLQASSTTLSLFGVAAQGQITALASVTLRSMMDNWLSVQAQSQHAHQLAEPQPAEKSPLPSVRLPPPSGTADHASVAVAPAGSVIESAVNATSVVPLLSASTQPSPAVTITTIIEHPQPEVKTPQPIAIAPAPMRVLPLVLESNTEELARPAARLSQRLLAWRDKSKADSGSPAGFASTSRSWRDCVALYARGSSEPFVMPEIIVQMCQSLMLVGNEADAIAHLYGAYLQGEAGVSRVALADRLHGDWPQALGRGSLARCAVINFAHAALTLAPCVIAYLDESPPPADRWWSTSTGSQRVVGALTLPMRDAAWEIVVGTVLQRFRGPVLVVDAHAVMAGLLEARIRGATALIDTRTSPRIDSTLSLAIATLPGPMLIVVHSEQHAAALGLS